MWQLKSGRFCHFFQERHMMPWARNLLKNDNKETELASKITISRQSLSLCQKVQCMYLFGFKLSWCVVRQVLTIKLASSIFFSTSRTALFLISENKRGIISGKFLYLIVHHRSAKRAYCSLRWKLTVWAYLHLTVVFCSLLYYLCPQARSWVHLRDLQTFLKT